VDAGPVFALAALIIGILMGERVDGSTSGVLLVALVALVAAWLGRGSSRLALVTIALACVGFAMTARAVDGQRNTPLAIGTLVTVNGTLVGDPGGGPYSATALVRISIAGTERTVLAAASGDDAMRLRVLEAGDRVTVAGRLAPLRTSATDDRAKWRHAVARLDGTEVIALRSPGALFSLADTLRDHILRGTRALAPTPRALLAGFLLGDTRGIPDDVVNDYRDSGLSHLLAVSGENVAFVLALAAPLLRRLPLAGRTVLALAIIVVFATMTRFEPSVLRASMMASVALLATLAGRPASRLRVLAYAVIVLLVIDPFLLHSVAFLLSCGASVGIALGEPPIARRLRGPRWLREPLAVSLAAQLGVTPVLLVVFGNVPVVTPFANLLAAPAAEVLGVYGLVASATAEAVPPLGPIVHVPTALLIAWVSGVARLGAAIPLRLDTRGAIACVALVAGVASVACARARHTVPDVAHR
jgi:competence protein ComEC